jgi:hypothetical protein
MSKRLVFSLGSVFFVILAVLYVLEASHFLTNMLFLVPPLLAVLAGIYAVRTYQLNNVHGQAMALFSAGLFCFLAGEILFFSYQFVFHKDPFPSVADIAYLAAYPLLLAAFLKEVSHHKINWRNFNKLIMILILLLLTVISLIVLYFSIYQAYSSTDSALTNTVAIGYGVADLILIVPSLFILKVALDYRGGKLFNSWVLLLFALLLMLTGDIL